MSDAFKTNPVALASLLGGLRDGTIQLPDFQRGWVWGEDRIIGVLASISRAFPIGAVMMLETGGEAKFAARPVEGVEATGLKAAAQLILDGQQRLTSLFQAMALGAPVNVAKPRSPPRRVWFYVNMEQALADPWDREAAFVAVPENRIRPATSDAPALDLSTPEKEARALHFPCSALLEGLTWGMGFIAAWAGDPVRTQQFSRFNTEIIERFKQYRLPVITLTNEVTKEAVCHVFEKVNTGGMVLTAFELLTASFAAGGFQLRRDWDGPAGTDGRWTYEGIWPRLKAHPVLRRVQQIDVLQAVALMSSFDAHRAAQVADPTGGSGRVQATRKAILDLPLQKYLDVRQDVVGGFVTAAKFLLELNVFRAEDVPYQTQLVPLAVILARLGKQWEDYAIKEKLRRWYWRGVLGELYGSAVETRMARDVPEVLAWIGGGPEPSTMTSYDFNPGRLLTLRMRLSAAYKGLYALMMGEHAHDWRTGTPLLLATHLAEGLDIHHIFPRKWCAEHGVDAERMDCIVNKTAISDTTNRMIGGQAPSDYLAYLESKGGLPPAALDARLRTHHILPENLRGNGFDAFFAARRTSLLRLIQQATGKAPLAEMTHAMLPEDDATSEEAADEAA